MATSAADIVGLYYEYFNQKDWQGMLSLLDEGIQHDANQGESRFGKAAFESFLAHMDRCYDENLSDLLIFTNAEHPERIACAFTVNGIYKKTDADLPPANGQHYRLPAAAFLEVHNEKISRITTFYNLPLWISLISA